ncbi:MAG: HDOD domain-containing protein [Candidatus Omnitrophica bacterium]|nr:HDOD domain-containing protein [Candidatus Omnitrophota bacterium]
MLKHCNSAYYGLPRVISSVSQAIMYLGFQTVRNMVLSSAVNQVFIKHDLSIYNYRKNGISDHSFAVAVACQTIARKLRPGLSDTAFTSGLLHDVGKIILGKYLREMNRFCSGGHPRQSSPVRELRNFPGWTTPRWGLISADNWNFPQRAHTGNRIPSQSG